MSQTRHTDGSDVPIPRNNVDPTFIGFMYCDEFTKEQTHHVLKSEGLSVRSWLSTVLGKTTFKLTLIVDIYFDTSKCPLRGD